MQITEISPQQRNPSRRNLCVDGAFALGVSAETLLRFGLRKGDSITHETLREIEKIEELINAKGAALRYLGVRPRTEKEIRDKLREKEFGDEEIARTIADLKGAGLLDDAAFARMYIRDAMLKRPSGAMALRRKLLLLGVDRTTVDEAIGEIFAETDLEAAALGVARDFVRKTRNIRNGETRVKLRGRVAAHLARRGFAWDVIQSVLKSLFAGSAGNEDEADL